MHKIGHMGKEGVTWPTF